MLLLDTCALLWLTTRQDQLSAKAKKLISNENGKVFVSAISAFEIAIKHQKKLLILPRRPEDWFARALQLHGLTEVAIDSKICALAAGLPRLHNDPMDRIIIATAMEHKLKIITPDKHIEAYKEAEAIW